VSLSRRAFIGTLAATPLLGLEGEPAPKALKWVNHTCTYKTPYGADELIAAIKSQRERHMDEKAQEMEEWLFNPPQESPSIPKWIDAHAT